MGPGDGEVLAAHLEWMRLRGLSASTIRRRRVVMGWVEASASRPLLQISAEDLTAWRAALGVAPDAV